MQLKVKSTPFETQLSVLDTQAIITNLQDKGFLDCDRIPSQDIKLALAYWFKDLIQSIEADPDRWIHENNLKGFLNHLPEPFEVEEVSCDELASF
jgi:hypothetical protein